MQSWGMSHFNQKCAGYNHASLRKGFGYILEFRK
ncbi:unnamed protein product, partial [Didymodactylos carnosus]